MRLSLLIGVACALTATTLFLSEAKADTYVPGGVIQTNQTWSIAGSPYVLTGAVFVGGAGTPVLTIEPGVEVRFAGSSSLTIGSFGPAVLSANGTEAEPILFTSNSTPKARGGPTSLRFDPLAMGPRSFLQNATLEYGGASAAPLRITGASPTVRNVVVRESSREGVLVESSGRPTFVNLTARDNTGSGVRLDTSAAPSLTGGLLASNGAYGLFCEASTCAPILDSVSIRDSGAYPLRVRMDTSLATVTVGPEARKMVERYGLTLASSRRLDTVHDAVTGEPYDTSILSSISVSTGATLTLDADARLLWANASSLTAGGGSLVASGAAAQPIVMEPRWPGGTWAGVTFQSAGSGASSVLRNVTVSRTSGNGVNVNSYSSLTLDNVTVQQSGADGLSLGSSAPVLRNVRIVNSTGRGADFSFSSPTWNGGGIEHAGTNGVYLYGSFPTLVNVTIEDVHGNASGTGYGIYAAEGGSGANLDRVTVSNTTGRAWRNKLSASIADVTLQRIGNQEMEWHGASLTTSRLFPLYRNETGALYRNAILSSLSISTGATLTLEPETTLLFATSQSLSVAGGSLVAEGTTERPIAFGPLSPTWGGLSFQGAGSGATSRLRNVTVSRTSGDGLNLNSYSPLTLDNVTIQQSGDVGLSLGSSAPVLRNVHVLNTTGHGASFSFSSPVWNGGSIQHAGRNGVYLYGSFPTLVNLSIDRVHGNATNTGYGLYAAEGGSGAHLSDLTIANVTGRPWRNKLSASVTNVTLADIGIQEMEWHGASLATNRVFPLYRNETSALYGNVILSTVSVSTGATLTLEPETVLRFAASQSLSISGGSLVAEGTLDRPIALDPLTSTWGGLSFQGAGGAASSQLRNVTVSRTSGDGVNFNSYSPATLDNVTIQQSGDAGLSLSSSAPVLRNVRVLNTTGHGASFSFSSPTWNGGSVEHAGRNGVYLYGSFPTLVNLTIDHAHGNATGTGYGLYAAEGGSGANLNGVSIANAAGRPWRNRVTASIVNLTVRASGIQEAELWGGSPTSSITLAPPYDAVTGERLGLVLLSSLALQNGAHLTLAPDLRLAVAASQSISLTSASSDLWAEGTRAQPILVTDATSLTPAWTGIIAQSAGRATLRNVTLEGAVDGFSATNGRIVTLDNVTLRNATGKGLELQSGAVATLQNATVVGNAGSGVWANDATLTIRDSNVTGNGANGVELRAQRATTLQNSTFAQNGRSGVNATLTNPALTARQNILKRNTGYGMDLQGSTGSVIVDNAFLANTAGNARATGSNTWNGTLTPGRNVAGGNFLGGNAWSDYAGEDLNGNGIGDTLLPYATGIVPGADNLPLMGNLFADFTVTTPDPVGAPRTRLFTDESRGVPETWAWSLGDGTTAASRSVEHTYATDGVYSASLTVTDSQGAVSTWTKQVLVDATPPLVENLTSGLPTQSASAPVTIRVSASDNLGIASVVLRASIDGGAFSTVPMAQGAGADWTASIAATGAAANVSYYAEATDVGGNAARTPTESYRTSNPPVIASVTRAPLFPNATSPVNVTVDATDDTGIASVHITYTIDNPAQPPIALDLVDGSWRGVIPAPGVHATVRLTVTATDQDGLATASAQQTYVADARAPTVSLSFQPASPNATTPIQVRATVTDESGAERADLTWSFEGGNMTVVSMTQQGPTLFVADVPATTSTGVLLANVTAMDRAGNTGAASGTLVVDGSSPVLSGLTDGLPAQDAQRLVTVRVNVTDDRGVSSVTLWHAVDGGARVATAMTLVGGGAWSAAISATLVAANVTYDAEARDAAGNVGRSAQAFYRTSRAPVLGDVLRVPAYPKATDPVALSVDATDDAGVATVQVAYTVDGASQPPIDLALSDGLWRGTLPAPGTNATVRLVVTATDTDGLATASAPVTYVADSAPPALTLSLLPANPRGDTPLEARVVVADASGADRVDLTWAFEGGAPTTLAMTPLSPTEFSASIPAQGATGTLFANATAFDRAGNAATASAIRPVDATPPTILGLTHPPAVVRADQPAPVVTWASDDQGLGSATLEYRFDEGPWNRVITVAVPGLRQANLTTLLPAAGAPATVTYNLTVADAAGNVASSSTFTLRATTVPYIVNVSRLPGDPEASDDVTLAMDITDDRAIATVNFTYAINDGATQTLPMTSMGQRYAVTVPATGADARGSWTVVAMDDDGFPGTATGSYSADSFPPVLGTLTWTPANVTEDTGSLTFAIPISDAGAGVDPQLALLHYRLGSDPERTLRLQPGAPAWQATLAGVDWDALQGTTGFFRVSAADLRGHVANGTEAVDLVDAINDPPIMTLLAPMPGETWSGVRDVRWRCANDDGPCLVEASYWTPSRAAWRQPHPHPDHFAYGSWTPIGATTAENLTWDTGAFTNVTKLRLVAQDAASTVVLLSEAFSVDNAPPTLFVSNPLVGGRVTMRPAGPLEGVANGTGSPLARLSVSDARFTLAASPVGQAAGNFSFAVSSSLAPGAYEVDVTATDTGGNAGTLRVALLVDAAAPVLSDARIEGPLVSTAAPVAVSVIASDDAGLAQVLVDGTPLALDETTGRYTGTVVAPAVAGPHVFAFEARDHAGNSASVGLDAIVVQGPDLTVENLTLVPARPPTGPNATLLARVANLGGLASSDATVFVAAGGRLLGTAATSVPANGSVDVTVAWDATGLAGPIALDIQVEGGPATHEADLTNNRASLDAFVDAPDLVVLGVEASPRNGAAGGTASLVVTLENRGGVDAARVQVQAMADKRDVTALVSSIETSVPAGASVEVALPFDTAPLVGNHVLHVEADTGIVPDLAPADNVGAVNVSYARYAPEQIPETLTFVPSMLPGATLAKLRGMAAGEFTGDDKLDFAAAGLDGSLWLYENAGKAWTLDNRTATVLFAPRLLANASVPLQGLASGDFTGDGRADLVAGAADGRVLLYAAPAFDAPRVLAEVGDDAFGLTVGDYDADGRLDLAVGNRLGHVSLFLDAGDGTFAFSHIFSTRDQPYGMTSGDYDQDGRVDIVVGDRLGQLDRLSNQVGVRFDGQLFADVGAFAHGLTTGDFDLNGRLDVAVLPLDGNLRLFYQRGGALVIDPLTLARAPGSLGLAAGDFDRDGDIDLVTASDAGVVTLLLNMMRIEKTTEDQPMGATGRTNLTTTVENPYARPMIGLNLTEQHGPTLEMRGQAAVVSCDGEPEVYPYDVRMTRPDGRAYYVNLDPPYSFWINGCGIQGEEAVFTTWTGPASIGQESFRLHNVGAAVELDPLFQRDRIVYRYEVEASQPGPVPTFTTAEYNLLGPTTTPPTSRLLSDDVSNALDASANVVNAVPDPQKRDRWAFDQGVALGDLAVVGLEVVPSGSPGYQVRTTFRNVGSVRLSGVTANILVDGAVVSVQGPWTLGPGESRAGNAHWLPTAPGNVTVEAVVNPTRVNLESGYENNAMSLTLEVPDVDLAIENVTLESELVEGRDAWLNFTLVNRGAHASRGQTVSFSDEGMAGLAPNMTIFKREHDAACGEDAAGVPECHFVSRSGSLAPVTLPDEVPPGASLRVSRRFWLADEGFASAGNRSYAFLVSRVLPFPMDARPADNEHALSFTVAPSPVDLTQSYQRGFAHFGTIQERDRVTLSNPVDDLLRINLPIQNAGGAGAASFRVHLRTAGGYDLGEWDWPGGLAGHERATWTLERAWGDVPPGSHEVIATLDSDDALNESREDNNLIRFPVKGKDVVLRRIEYSNPLPAPGESIMILATVDNTGDIRTGPTQVTFLVDDAPIGTTTVDIPAHGTTRVAIPYLVPASGSPRHVVRAVADATDVIRGEWEADNELTSLLHVGAAELRILHESLGIHRLRPLAATDEPGIGWTTADEAPFFGGHVTESRAAPRFADLDGDGDADLALGSLAGDLRLYENQGGGAWGEVAAPTWRPVPPDSGFHSVPALGDVNGDGRTDILIAALDGTYHLYEHLEDRPFGWERVAGAPGLGQVLALPRAAPALADVDGDLDLDLVIGKADGGVAVHANEGNATTPRFNASSFPLGPVAASGHAAPTFADVTGDGLLDLLLGGADGNISTYAGPAPWTLLARTSLPNATHASPGLVDLTGDGRLDIVAGADEAAPLQLFQGYTYALDYKVVNHASANRTFWGVRLAYRNETSLLGDAQLSNGFTIPPFSSHRGSFTENVPREIPNGSLAATQAESRLPLALSWTERPDLGGYAVDLPGLDGRRYEVFGSHAQLQGGEPGPLVACIGHCPLLPAPDLGSVVTLVAPAPRSVVAYDRIEEALPILEPELPAVEVRLARVGTAFTLQQGYVEDVELETINRNRVPVHFDRLSFELRTPDGRWVDLYTDTSGLTLPALDDSTRTVKLYVPEGAPLGSDLRVRLARISHLGDGFRTTSHHAFADQADPYANETAWGLARWGEGGGVLRRVLWLDSGVEKAEVFTKVWQDCFFDPQSGVEHFMGEARVSDIKSAPCLTTRHGWLPVTEHLVQGTNRVSFDVFGPNRAYGMRFYDIVVDMPAFSVVVAPERPAWSVALGEFGQRGLGHLRRDYPEPVNLTVTVNDDDPVTLSVATFDLVAPDGRTAHLSTDLTPREQPALSTTNRTYRVQLPDDVPLGASLRFTAERIVPFPDALWLRNDNASVADLLAPGTPDRGWGESSPPLDAVHLRKAVFLSANVTRAELSLAGDPGTRLYLDGAFQGAGYPGWSPLGTRTPLAPAALNQLSIRETEDGEGRSQIRETLGQTYVGRSFTGGVTEEPEEPSLFAVFGLRSLFDRPDREPFQVYPGERVTARIRVTNEHDAPREVALRTYLVNLATGLETSLDTRTVTVPTGDRLGLDLPLAVPSTASEGGTRIQLSASWVEPLADKAWLRSSNVNDDASANPLLNDSGWGVVEMGPGDEHATHFRKHLWLNSKVEEVAFRIQGVEALWVNGLPVDVRNCGSGFCPLTHNEGSKGAENLFTVKARGLDADVDIQVRRFVPVRATDLDILDLATTSPSTLDAGAIVPLTFRLRNTGDVFSRDVQLEAHALSPGGEVVPLLDEVVALHPFANETWTASWDTTGLAGPIRLRLAADRNDRVIETSEGNNEASLSFYVNQPPSVSLSAPRLAGLGTPIQVRVNATDPDGNLAALEATVESPDGAAFPLALSPTGATGASTGTFTPTLAGDHTIRISAADALGRLAEASALVHARAAVALTAAVPRETYSLGEVVRLRPSLPPLPPRAPAGDHAPLLLGARDDADAVAPHDILRVSAAATDAEGPVALFVHEAPVAAAEVGRPIGLLCEARAARDPSCFFRVAQTASGPFAWFAYAQDGAGQVAGPVEGGVLVDADAPAFELLSVASRLDGSRDGADDGKTMLVLRAEPGASGAFGRDAALRFHLDRRAQSLDEACVGSNAHVVCNVRGVAPTPDHRHDLAHVSLSDARGVSLRGDENADVRFDVVPAGHPWDDYAGGILPEGASVTLHGSGVYCLDATGECEPSLAFADGTTVPLPGAGAWHLRYRNAQSPTLDTLVLVNSQPTLGEPEFWDHAGEHAFDVRVPIQDADVQAHACVLDDGAANRSMRVAGGRAFATVMGTGTATLAITCTDGFAAASARLTHDFPDQGPVLLPLSDLVLPRNGTASLDLAPFVVDSEGDPVTLVPLGNATPSMTLGARGLVLDAAAGSLAGVGQACFEARSGAAPPAVGCMRVAIVEPNRTLLSNLDPVALTLTLQMGVDYWNGTAWLPDARATATATVPASGTLDASRIFPPWQSLRSPHTGGLFQGGTFRAFLEVQDASGRALARAEDAFLLNTTNEPPSWRALPEVETIAGFPARPLDLAEYVNEAYQDPATLEYSVTREPTPAAACSIAAARFLACEGLAPGIAEIGVRVFDGAAAADAALNVTVHALARHDVPLQSTFELPLDENGTWQTGPGDAGTYLVNVTTTDGDRTFTQLVVVTVLPHPWAPIIHNGDETTREGTPFRVVANVTDANNENRVPDDDENITVTYSLPLNETTGEWTPTYDDAGVHAVVITAADGTFVVQRIINVTVLNTNRAPEVKTSDVWTVEGERVHVAPAVRDPDNENAPTNDDNTLATTFGAPLNATGEWDPQCMDAGTYPTYAEVSDGELTSRSNFTIHVNESPDFLILVEDIVYHEQDLVDLGRDVHRLLHCGPGFILNATYDAPLDASGRWQTTHDDAGNRTLRANLATVRGPRELVVNATILNVNRAPTLEPLPNVTVRVGDLVAVRVVARDPDNENGAANDDTPLTVTHGAPLNRLGTWTPGPGDVGTHQVRVNVTDGQFNATRTFTITVNPSPLSGLGMVRLDPHWWMPVPPGGMLS